MLLASLEASCESNGQGAPSMHYCPVTKFELLLCRNLPAQPATSAAGRQLQDRLLHLPLQQALLASGGQPGRPVCPVIV